MLPPQKEDVMGFCDRFDRRRYEIRDECKYRCRCHRMHTQLLNDAYIATTTATTKEA